MKLLLTTLSLTVLPMFAVAEGCSWSRTEASASCADGFTWDAKTQTCITATTS